MGNIGFRPKAGISSVVEDASFQKTLAETMGDDASPATFGVTVIRNRIFSGNITDKAHILSAMEASNRAIIDALPPDRLLVYQVSQGWEPLCGFLDVPVPTAPFPSTNSTAEFRTRIGKTGPTH